MRETNREYAEREMWDKCGVRDTCGALKRGIGRLLRALPHLQRTGIWFLAVLVQVDS